MSRYFFDISYKGTNYHGWQVQRNAISIQEVIQEKLKQLGYKSIEITGSGRTDTGVHAKQQIFHTDFANEINEVDFIYHLNAVLPKDIAVKSIRKVNRDAHARFDAEKRCYDYIVTSQKNPFRIDLAYYYVRTIDLEALNKASKILIGKHNFEAFSKVKTQVNNFLCEIFDAHWKLQNSEIVFHIEANRFLRGMVRTIVGTLLDFNEGKIDINNINKILASKDRRKAGKSVPAHGLYLSKITYPENLFEN